jgi:hypothetical protein
LEGDKVQVDALENQLSFVFDESLTGGINLKPRYSRHILKI